MKRNALYLAFLLLLLVFSGCQQQQSTPVMLADVTPTPSQEANASLPDVPIQTATETPSATEAPSDAFTLTSSGIVNGVISDDFGARATQTKAGIPNRSFALTFANVPEGTVCIALTMIDPDGGNWVHWLVASAPVDGLPENASVDLADSLVQGKNDFRFTGYGGPTPPMGTHTYVLTAYALSEAPVLETGFSLKELTQAIDGKVLATAVLNGTYTH
ncbi:MAG TPA: YbhB/YbcL family Raf kinase inhibitor-like protein [Candidatus Cryosericum sp.]|nr:YbhB/YbcL family Raf kinase inhibitor-like protein [Candidatus Cryosericum sp.]